MMPARHVVNTPVAAYVTRFPSWLTLKTMMVKVFGVLFSVGASMPVGDGPVHSPLWTHHSGVLDGIGTSVLVYVTPLPRYHDLFTGNPSLGLFFDYLRNRSVELCFR